MTSFGSTVKSSETTKRSSGRSISIISTQESEIRVSKSIELRTTTSKLLKKARSVRTWFRSVSARLLFCGTSTTVKIVRWLSWSAWINCSPLTLSRKLACCRTNQLSCPKISTRWERLHSHCRMNAPPFSTARATRKTHLALSSPTLPWLTYLRWSTSSTKRRRISTLPRSISSPLSPISMVKPSLNCLETIQPTSNFLKSNWDALILSSSKMRQALNPTIFCSDDCTTRFCCPPVFRETMLTVS